MLSIAEIAVLEATKYNTSKQSIVKAAAEAVGSKHFDSGRAMVVLDRLVASDLVLPRPNGYMLTDKGQRELYQSVVDLRAYLAGIL